MIIARLLIAERQSLIGSAPLRRGEAVDPRRVNA
jgi:hypothetical protein